MNDTRRYLTVTELNQMVQARLEEDPDLSYILLEGEISNFKPYSSGHIYFSLKDENSLISAVMWRSYVPNLSFTPKNGDRVLVRGKINVFTGRGTYQISVFAMEMMGQGEDLKNLRLLAAKLRKEGLFDESRKRKIPSFPTRIAVIAGQGSAGLKDIQVNLAKRWPLAEVYCFPALVQGDGAPASLLEALKQALVAKPDTLIIGRGGGSSEDLRAFNDETLVRFVAACSVPVIAAVGHEIDVTLIDLVADWRASTPTGAAVKATPDQNDVYQALDDYSVRLEAACRANIATLRQSLLRLSERPYFKDPSKIYDPQKDRIATLEKNLDSAYRNFLLLKKEKASSLSQRITPAYGNALQRIASPLLSLEAKLDSLNPESVMDRGYSMTLDERGKPIHSAAALQQGQIIKTHFKDGIITSKIVEKESKDA